MLSSLKSHKANKAERLVTPDAYTVHAFRNLAPHVSVFVLLY
jgi:hypothetical protein